jgi:glucan endo-1,6-beta-glucosidase
VKFLEWLAREVHTANEFRNVGMLELVNEPLTWNDAQPSLRSAFYKRAYDSIRAAESQLGTATKDYLHVQMMGSKVRYFFGAFRAHRFSPS